MIKELFRWYFMMFVSHHERHIIMFYLPKVQPRGHFMLCVFKHESQSVHRSVFVGNHLMSVSSYQHQGGAEENPDINPNSSYRRKETLQQPIFTSQVAWQERADTNLLCLRSSSCMRLCRLSVRTRASWRSEVTRRQWRFSSVTLRLDCSSWACSVATYARTYTHTLTHYYLETFNLPSVLQRTSRRPASPWYRAVVGSVSPSPVFPPSAWVVCGQIQPPSGSTPAAWPARCLCGVSGMWLWWER